MGEHQESIRSHANKSIITPDAIEHETQTTDLFHDEVTAHMLLEAMAEAVLLIQRDGTIIYVNHRTEELFGYSVEELIGQPLNKILPKRYHDVHLQHLKGFFAQPRIRPLGHGLNLVGQRKDGSEVPLEISLGFLNTRSGLVALAFCTDATRRTQIELDLKLRNEQLDAFAHTVAHDLNSSLAIVVGFSEQLAEIYDTLTPEEMHHYLLIIARSGRKMSNIVNELLLFASMRREEVPLEPLNMTAIVHEAIARLRDTQAEYQAQISVPEKFPLALGHAPWVEEVWYNYLSNAIKYGGRPPYVEIGYEPPNNGQVRFWVKDNGRGLTTEQQALLFTPYSQLEYPQIKGHGLGLSIVRQIVEKLGGQAGVTSDGVPDRGSTFFFTLRGP